MQKNKVNVQNVQNLNVLNGFSLKYDLFKDHSKLGQVTFDEVESNQKLMTD